MRGSWARIIVCLCVLYCGFHASAQMAFDYDALVRQGDSQLKAGRNDLALTTALSAIKVNADRWEAYALAGGALMNLKRYEEATDNLSHAIDRAPEAKQEGLRNLRKQCLLAEASGASTPDLKSSPVPLKSASLTTQAEIVLWKTIENSNDPIAFSGYLQQYPNGTYATIARKHLDQLHDDFRGQCVQANNPLTGRKVTLTIKDKHESAAFFKALGIADPAAKAQALRSFVDAYPSSVASVQALREALLLNYNAKLYGPALDDAHRLLQRDPGNVTALFLASVLDDEQAKTEKDIDSASRLQLESITFLQRCASQGK